MIEWLAIPAGIVAGALSGWASAWVGRPAAQAAAEETKLRTERRRQLVDDGRALVADAYGGDWKHEAVALDPRFLALRGDLSPAVRDAYAIEYELNVVAFTLSSRWNHEPLRDDIERLNGVWALS